MDKAFALILMTICFSAQAEVPEYLRKILEETASRFETNITEVFHYRAAFHPVWPVRKIDSFLVTVNGYFIQLRDLQFTEPDIIVNSFKMNMANLVLRAEMTIKDFTLEGTYEIASDAVPFPSGQKGNISFMFKDVKGIVRDGILVLQDSFALTKNYDFEFKANALIVKASFCDSLSEKSVSKTAWVKPDKRIIPGLWPQVSYVLSKTYNYHLGVIIEEQSVKEILKDSVMTFRKRSKFLIETANKVIDFLISSANEVIVSNNETSIPLPPFSVKYQKECEHLGLFEAEQGFIKDLSSLRRTAGMDSLLDESYIVVHGHLNLKKLKFGFRKFTAKCGKDNTEGRLATEVESNKLHVEISLIKKYRTWIGKLEKLTFLTVTMDSTAIIGKVGNYFPLQSIHPWTVGWFRSEGLSALENTLRNAFEKAIRKTDFAKIL